MADYVDTGDVKFSYINVLFQGNESVVGSLAAEAVYEQSPESYCDFHKALFAAQPSEHALNVRASATDAAPISKFRFVILNRLFLFVFHSVYLNNLHLLCRKNGIFLKENGLRGVE